MIVDKRPQIILPLEPTPQEAQVSEVQEVVSMNPMVGAYRAVREILETLTEDPADPESPRLFKTIKLDNGQLARVKKAKANMEYGIVFPAVFIHYINVYYNVGTSRIAEGKGTMRIHYVLDRLNNSDDVAEEEGFRVYKRIVDAIEANKAKFPALVQRFQLAYWDQPLSFDDGLQPYWIDYQIWFQDYSGYAYKDYVDAYITEPPYTQPTDQNEIANPDGLPNWDGPKFEELDPFAGQL